MCVKLIFIMSFFLNVKLNIIFSTGDHKSSVKGGRPLERGQDQDRLRKQIMSFRHSVRGQDLV